MGAWLKILRVPSDRGAIQLKGNALRSAGLSEEEIESCALGVDEDIHIMIRRPPL